MGKNLQVKNITHSKIAKKMIFKSQNLKKITLIKFLTFIKVKVFVLMIQIMKFICQEI